MSSLSTRIQEKDFWVRKVVFSPRCCIFTDASGPLFFWPLLPLPASLLSRLSQPAPVSLHQTVEHDNANSSATTRTTTTTKKKEKEKHSPLPLHLHQCLGPHFLLRPPLPLPAVLLVQLLEPSMLLLDVDFGHGNGQVVLEVGHNRVPKARAEGAVRFAGGSLSKRDTKSLSGLATDKNGASDSE